MRALTESTPDAQLVELSLAGNRDAFERVVARYQSLLCGIAYSSCGDFGRSEDLAQDTFVAAWKDLHALNEPAKLKNWLCGITRHLVNDSTRRELRTPTSQGGVPAQELQSEAATPDEYAISKEEEMLVWRTLETIPVDYRVPMVLFYREGRSTKAVAEALDLSDEAVRQRLSRGRVMLSENVAKAVEAALAKSGPTKAFTNGVLFALGSMPAVKGTVASEPLASATATHTGLASWLSVTLGPPLLGLTSVWTGFRLSVLHARSEPERGLIKKAYSKLFAWLAACSIVFVLLAYWSTEVGNSDRSTFAFLATGFVLVQAVGIVGIRVWARRQGRTLLMNETGIAHPEKPVLEYRSSRHFLGLPLVHIRIGRGTAGPCRPVKAWLAFGEFATGGLFAFGTMAIAPVAAGGCAIGLISFGGLALGSLALGGLALGWEAFGACAVGWHAALGIIAFARDYAIGGIAFAAQANNEVAGGAVDEAPFFFLVKAVVRNLGWFCLMALVPLSILARKAKSKMPPTGRSNAVSLTTLVAVSAMVWTHAIAQPPPKKTFMWQVTNKAGNKGYVVGSMHLAVPGIYPLPQSMTAAFEKADTLVVETDITKIDLDLLRRKIREQGMYQGDDDLSKHLSPDMSAPLDALCKEHGLPANVYKMKPWLIWVTLQPLIMQKAGLTVKDGIDLHFLTEAAKTKKQVVPLESAEFQFDLLASFSEREQLRELRMLLNRAPHIQETAKALTAAWMSGDENTIAGISAASLGGNADPELDGVVKKVVDDRNGPMAEKMANALDEGRRIFVVVGAAHLPKEHGILQLLRDKGYIVTQMGSE